MRTKTQPKKLLKEGSGSEWVQQRYNLIIQLIQNESRRLNDDDCFELHEKLKAFFNKTI